jgi:S-adenosylmethionine synthetase
MRRDIIFTSESVTPGHPDKLCDQVSDAGIDAFLRQDPRARATIECAIATGVLFIAARFAAEATVDLPSLARTVLSEAGYVGDGFDARSCSILTNLTQLPDSERSPDADGLDAEAVGKMRAEEQANVFGFACSETELLMPLPISLAHGLARALAEARATEAAWLAPDAKTQVAVRYHDGRPSAIHSITLTVSVTEKAPTEAKIVTALRALVVDRVFDGGKLSAAADTAIHVNIGDPYVTGGPSRHAGLTGRKNGIDTYGEYARQSGAALSGKDPSRVDRIGAYAARHAAKNVVAAGLAERCEVHLAYAIGQTEPISLAVDTHDTGRIPDDEIAERLARSIDFRPLAVTKRFRLRELPARAGQNGFFRPLAVYGHVGRPDLDLPWEQTDLVAALRD